ncbi:MULTISPECIES: aldo/keto reductase [unclassified Bacillus (in: firmicutes)]|uniref:aldo/keto reductase n=1 Tax=unclassified Bacillus (in: firmicutes) TaxID=185979 RepID=UPI001BE6DF8F|nr:MULTISPECIES: aldo/keto reductase [unclassified Bacillus (in: firmicutes)]MBT2721692.1 aldo/keto reductase [Bacillus sp. ISL-46]MBT2730825.1 aldo/keto reductase [Bacillus sp. ISL-75]
MKKRRLGNSDLYVSELGLGCMSIGTEEKTARKIIEASLEEGINYFDTADLYDFGENEKIVGTALKEVRENVIIATKVGNRWSQDQKGWSWDPSKSYIKEEVKQSLNRLGTDYIDLYQLHGGTINDPIEETIEAFEELKAEGYIRYYGISSIRPNVIREYVNKSSIVSVMMQYSILDRRPEEEALPLLQEHGLSVVTRGPLAKGLLSDKMLEKVTEKGYQDYSLTELNDVLPLLKEKVAATRSFTEIALQYNLAHPVVASVVAGASSPEQIRSNAKAVRSQPLSEEEVSVIRELTKAGIYKEHR